MNMAGAEAQGRSAYVPPAVEDVHLPEHSVPLLAQQERYSEAPQQQPEHQQPGQQPATGVPTSTATLPSHNTQLNIHAAVAAYPIVTGQPVQLPSNAMQMPGMMVLTDLPNAMQLWRAQRGTMIAWFWSSIFSLLLFAPFFITSGLFLAAEIAAILGIMASSMHLCKRDAIDGLELGTQIKAAAACGAAACFLDALTALMALLVVWSVDCEGDEACSSIMSYAVFFGLYLSFHAYMSVTIGSRARAMLPLLNPVTSGVVRL